VSIAGPEGEAREGVHLAAIIYVEADGEQRFGPF